MADFQPVSEDQSRVVLMYGMNPTEGENAEWYQLDFYKKQGKPTSSRQKAAIIADINERITAQIVGGMTFENKPVWLSIESRSTSPQRQRHVAEDW